MKTNYKAKKKGNNSFGRGISTLKNQGLFKSSIEVLKGEEFNAKIGSIKGFRVLLIEFLIELSEIGHFKVIHT